MAAGAAPDRCFDPVVRADTRLLVLGSLPGQVSLARQRYYAYPQNQFWRLIGPVIGRDIAALPYEARLEALLDRGVGLWDTVGSGRRIGSLDQNIRLEQASDLAGLVATLPHLRGIGFNGGTSARIGRRVLGDPAGLTLLDLPSSSPAYTLAFDHKLATWMGLRDLLHP